MEYKKKFIFGASFFALLLSGCGIKTPTESSYSEEPPVEEDETVDVFVLSGQSNMEGSTYFDNGKDWLYKACDALELDATPMFEGYENIYTSFYGYYPYGGPVTPHASNVDDPLAGLFMNTTVGMGNRDDFMGPEIGLAEALKDKASESRPIYFIKCAFSGSGFSSNNPNWVNDPSDKRYNADENLYENKLKVFTENNLRLIEEMGKTPIIRGFLWHQGESDTSNSNYGKQLGGLADRFREDFADYALDGDGENIAFIDGYIYDGPSSPYGQGAQTLNNQKKALAESKDNNYVVNTSYNIEGGMKLEIGLKQGDVEGGCDIYHYKTKDCVRLGLGYGEIILDNILID